MPSPSKLTPEQRCQLRDLLRAARLEAQQDREAVDRLLHAIERVGLFLKERAAALGQYEGVIVGLVLSGLPNHEALARGLFDQVRTGRNDAQHIGAFAHHLVSHATRLALLMEDSLMTDMNQIEHYAVTTPICAELWHPVAWCRQQMLENNFSILPVLDNGVPRYFLIDAAISIFLRFQADREPKRDARLGLSLLDAFKTESIARLQLRPVESEDKVKRKCVVVDCIERLKHSGMLLVMDDEHLVGVVTPFDVL